MSLKRKAISIDPKKYPAGSVRRKAAQVIRQDMAGEINQLIGVVNTQCDLINVLFERVRVLEAKLSDPEPPSNDLPDDVKSKNDLIEFAEAMFPQEVDVFYQDMGPFCRKLRDALADTYPQIERINDQQERFGYIAPEEKHSDAFYRVDRDQIIDFMIASKLPGVPIEQLSWGVNPVTPW